jgi:hypothetical protein
MPDQDTSTRDPLSYRPATLLLRLLGYVADADGDVPLDELHEAHVEADYPYRTVDNAFRDLVNYGAFVRVGRGRRNDPGNVRLTVLGRHWLEQTPPPPLPGQEASS